MDDEKTIMSLELLFLNDLLHSEAIDKSIYNQAVHKIITSSKDDNAADRNRIIISK